MSVGEQVVPRLPVTISVPPLIVTFTSTRQVALPMLSHIAETARQTKDELGLVLARTQAVAGAIAAKAELTANTKAPMPRIIFFFIAVLGLVRS